MELERECWYEEFMGMEKKDVSGVAGRSGGESNSGLTELMRRSYRGGL